MLLIDKLLQHPQEDTLKDAFDWLVQNKTLDTKSRINYAKKIRIEARKINTKPMLDLVYRTYLHNARLGQFEDYLIYLEKDRAPEKRFYLPRIKVMRSVVQDIQKLLDDELDLLTISMPCGVGKSAIESFLLSYVCGLYPDKPNMLSSYSGMLTNSIYVAVLGIMQDEEYKWSEVFPNVKGIYTNTKEQILDIDKRRKNSTLTCRAINGSLTGMRIEGLLCADDLVSGIEEALNIERLDSLWQKYTNDFKSRKKLGAKEIHICTRWSVHDVIGRLERMYSDDPRAKFVVLPALNENGESNFNYDYKLGFDTQYYEDMKKTLDDASFRALYMNEPIEREGLLFQREELRYYYELPSVEPDYIVGVCDTAEGGGDDTVLPIGYGYGEDWYMEDFVCSDDKPEITVPLCVEKLIKNDVKMCQFESNSAGGGYADRVASSLKERGNKCNITKKRTTANKETKIFINSTWVKEHCLFKDVSVASKEYNEVIRKLCSYSLKGKNKHDDVPDGMAQFAEFVQGIQGRKIQFFKRPF